MENLSFIAITKKKLDLIEVSGGPKVPHALNRVKGTSSGCICGNEICITNIFNCTINGV